jgi:hypothetical protein
MLGMNSHLTDVRAVIECLGGAKEVAQLFGISTNAVHNWVMAERLPANTYLVIREKLKARRKKVPDSLFRMADPKARARKRASEGVPA